MIYGYEVKKIDNEETLCLYMDFSLEFGRLRDKDKNQKLSSIIRDYIKEKNIKFNGKKIAIISGGLLMATVMLKAPFQNQEFNQVLNDSYPKSVLLIEENNYNVEVEEEVELPKFKEDISENKERTDVKILDKKETPKKENAVSKVESSVVVDSNTNKNDFSESKPEVIDENIYVAVKRSNGTILNIELEEYVLGVVGAEMPASFNIEALKAQAVLARTYALKSVEKKMTLTDNSSTQNYKDTAELKAMWSGSFKTYYNKIKKAVNDTKGMYLTYEGKLIEAVYHSTSNGSTEDAKFVWGQSHPYLVPVSSPYDSSNSSYLKEVILTYEILSEKLGFNINQNSDIQIINKTAGDRVMNISIDNNLFTGVFIRNTLGLRSADFDVEKTDNGLKFTTRGFGHGVGMSQYGANGLAKNGANYETILKHYYLGVEIQKL